jgi:hypothetical protein
MSILAMPRPTSLLPRAAWFRGQNAALVEPFVAQFMDGCVTMLGLLRLNSVCKLRQAHKVTNDAYRLLLALQPYAYYTGRK